MSQESLLLSYDKQEVFSCADVACLDQINRENGEPMALRLEGLSSKDAFLVLIAGFPPDNGEQRSASGNRTWLGRFQSERLSCLIAPGSIPQWSSVPDRSAVELGPGPSRLDPIAPKSNPDAERHFWHSAKLLVRPGNAVL